MSGHAHTELDPSEPVPGLDPAEFPCLAALAAADATGTLADELRRFERRTGHRQSYRRTARHRTVTVGRLQASGSTLAVVVQDLSSTGVRLRLDKRHRPAADGPAELELLDGDARVKLPLEFVRVAARDKRDIDLAYRFASLNSDQQQAVNRLKGAGLPAL